MTDISRIRQIAFDYIDRLILTSDPLRPRWNTENFIFRKEPRWNYMDSCIIRALLMFSDDHSEYTDYALRFVNSYVSPDGTIPTVERSDYNLDSICGGRNLLYLYEKTNDERYLIAAKQLYEQLVHQPRLSCGSFWHKAIYPNQIWLDGAYMALPFLVAYGKKTGEKSSIDDALNQLKNIRTLMRDDKTGLYYHGYCEPRNMCWSDSKTGLSPNIWLRSNGWLCVGLVDIFEMTGNIECADMLSDLLEAMCSFLTSDNMLMQLPVLKELGGNYPETSGTLLFSYSAMKAYRLGAVSDEIADAGRRALNTVSERYIVYDGDIPVLRNICLMGGLGGSEGRDGSVEYYLSERVVENDAKGIAPFLMAVSELI